jgi:hypothetical protein
MQVEGGHIHIVQTHDFLSGFLHLIKIAATAEVVGSRDGGGIHGAFELTIGNVDGACIYCQSHEQQQDDQQQAENYDHLTVTTGLWSAWGLAQQREAA